MAWPKNMVVCCSPFFLFARCFFFVPKDLGQSEPNILGQRAFSQTHRQEMSAHLSLGCPMLVHLPGRQKGGGRDDKKGR